MMRSRMAFLPCRSAKKLVCVLYFCPGTDVARAATVSSGSYVRSPTPMSQAVCPMFTAFCARRMVVKPAFSVATSLTMKPIRIDLTGQEVEDLKPFPSSFESGLDRRCVEESREGRRLAQNAAPV